MKPTRVSVYTWFGTIHPRQKRAFVMARVLVGTIHPSTAQYSGPMQPTKVNALSKSWVAAAVFKILLKHLVMKLYELQLGQAVKLEDVAVWYEFSAGTGRFIISEEATFSIDSKVDRHDICVWRTENHHTTLSLERELSKQNVFCAITKDTGYDPFISMGTLSQVTRVQKCFPYGLCTSWKKI
jgi:hypothetical protein